MPGKGKLTLTGQLGDVMKESAQAALSYVRANADRFGIPRNFLDESDIHIHVPAGAMPKDGPSAGVTMLTALVSLLTGIRVRHDVAMTGEITLRGRVLPIGGLKEKVLAAHRAGIKRVIVPERNRADLDEVPEEVKSEPRLRLRRTNGAGHRGRARGEAGVAGRPARRRRCPSPWPERRAMAAAGLRAEAAPCRLRGEDAAPVMCDPRRKGDAHGSGVQR